MKQDSKKNNKLLVKINSLILAASTLLINFSSVVLARNNFGDPTKIGEALESVEPTANPLIGTFVAIILYISIIVVGLNIIMYRNRSEERSSAMTGLFYIAIGCLIITSAYTISNFIMSIV